MQEGAAQRGRPSRQHSRSSRQTRPAQQPGNDASRRARPWAAIRINVSGRRWFGWSSIATTWTAAAADSFTAATGLYTQCR